MLEKVLGLAERVVSVRYLLPFSPGDHWPQSTWPRERKAGRDWPWPGCLPSLRHRALVLARAEVESVRITPGPTRRCSLLFVACTAPLLLWHLPAMHPISNGPGLIYSNAGFLVTSLHFRVRLARFVILVGLWQANWLCASRGHLFRGGPAKAVLRLVRTWSSLKALTASHSAGHPRGRPCGTRWGEGACPCQILPRAPAWALGPTPTRQAKEIHPGRPGTLWRCAGRS